WHFARADRRPVPAVQRHLCQGERARPGHRASHRDRLQRRDTGEFTSRRRNDRRSQAARAGGSCSMTQADTAGVAPATERRQPRILVVDDEPSMRELLAIVLRREGYEVVLAENGRTA